MSTTLRPCEVCGHGHVTELVQYSVSPWPVVSCDGCGFVFLHHVPGYQALVEDYAWEKTHAAEAKRRKSRHWNWMDQATRWRLKLGKSQDRSRQTRALGGTGNGLDIGCGGACRLPGGITPYGIEISAGLAERARPFYEGLGGRLICAPAIEGLDTFESGFFSSMLMRSYLEHEERPRAVLEKAFDKLRQGGVIYVRVPDFGSLNRRTRGVKWCGFRFPDHVNYFTGHSLKLLANSIGYEYTRKNWASVFDDNLTVELRKPMR